MIIGVPKEIKISENRVGLTEAGAKQLVKEGHTVYVQKNAGLGSGISNEAYVEAGAKLLDSAKEVYDKSEMIWKVKEPLPAEYDLLRENQILYTYLPFGGRGETHECSHGTQSEVGRLRDDPAA